MEETIDVSDDLFHEIKPVLMRLPVESREGSPTNFSLLTDATCHAPEIASYDDEDDMTVTSLLRSWREDHHDPEEERTMTFRAVTPEATRALLAKDFRDLPFLDQSSKNKQSYKTKRPVGKVPSYKKPACLFINFMGNKTKPTTSNPQSFHCPLSPLATSLALGSPPTSPLSFAGAEIHSDESDNTASHVVHAELLALPQDHAAFAPWDLGFR